MAASTKSPERIAELRQSEVPVPLCDEFEKMISGMNFNTGNSQEMMEYKLATKRKLLSFNDDSIPEGSTLASLKSRRMAVAKEMFGKLGQDVTIEPPFFLLWGCNTFIGNGVYMNRELDARHSTHNLPNSVIDNPRQLLCHNRREQHHNHKELIPPNIKANLLLPRHRPARTSILGNLRPTLIKQLEPRAPQLIHLPFELAHVCEKPPTPRHAAVLYHHWLVEYRYVDA
ncbi:galactoside o-acetyltransferase [Fusarium pseudoanthophilum]|uniref:Galactoside o-acetyltransferase n=1 Tax=Fusarium pseudoanthophilum TaxID=48495 RepID=A0A8H5NQQ8_9HYPO|nr:galactoside o-acetyltransferase [Fusarium pseudoanthophilum]